MNNRTALIAVSCGLLAAWLFLSPLVLGGLGMVFSVFTAAPIFVSVLGFGTLAGIISGATGSLIALFLLGPLSALMLLLCTLGPALWIGHMAGLSRDDNNDGVMEWYPLSEILLRMAGMCAIITIAIGLLTGFSIDAATAQIAAYLKQFLSAAQTGGAAALTDAQIEARAIAAGKLITIGFPASLLFLMVGNVLIAERFARKRGWILRPKEELKSTVALPFTAVGIFVIAVAIALLGGTIGLLAQVVAGAFGAAFAMVGLATMHFMTRNIPARGFMLGITYFAFLSTRIIAPLMAVFGVVETVFGIRTRVANRTSKP